jgi:hypothetical protein
MSSPVAPVTIGSDSTGGKQMAIRKRLFVSLAFVVALGTSLATPPSSRALIHEIIGAECRAGGEEVVPPGQAQFGTQSFVRALLATGVIESIDDSDPSNVVVTFDLDRPNAKYVSAGFDLTIPDGFGPGVALTLSPLPVADNLFAAYANCRNLNQ